MNGKKLLFVAAVTTAAVALLLLSGCGKKPEEQAQLSREELAKQIIPDSLSYTEKVSRLTALSFQNLSTLVQNHPEERHDFGVALTKLLPKEEFFALFEGKDIKFFNLYYGVGSFSGIYPVDPALDIDSTLAQLNLEARSSLAENIRIGNEEVANITDEVQREKAQAELDKLAKSLEELDSGGGVQFYGCEVEALPGDLMALMNNPDRVIQVIFPGDPTEGSWVRLSPYRRRILEEKDRQTALQ